MIFKKKLPSVEELISEYPLSEKLKGKRLQRTMEIKKILSGKDSRKILFVGPCSADREDAVLDYMKRLKLRNGLKGQVIKLIIVIAFIVTSFLATFKFLYDKIDLKMAMRKLKKLFGIERVLCEGEPTTNATLFKKT